MIKSRIVFRCDPAFRRRLEAAAAADRRTLSGWVRVVLERALDAVVVHPPSRPRGREDRRGT